MLYDKEERKAKDALINCSTVSRTWRELALPYLFHTVAFYFDPDMECWITADDGPGYIDADDDDEVLCCEERIRTLQGFLTFIEASPNVASKIQEIRLIQVDRDELVIPREPWSHPCDLDQLVSIFHRLPKLRVVHLQDVEFMEEGPGDRYDLQELQEEFSPPVSLSRFYFGVSEDLCREEFHVSTIFPLLWALGDVDEFILDLIALQKSELVPKSWEEQKIPPPYLKISNLKLKGWYQSYGGLMRDFLSLLLKSGSTSVESLHSIHLCNPGIDDLPVIQKFIGAVGPQLTKITLEIAEFPSDDDEDHSPTIDSLDLSPCTMLESLTIEDRLSTASARRNGGSETSLFADLAPVVAKLHSHARLQTVTFVLSSLWGRAQVLDKAVGTTEEMDDALVQIPSLKRVVLDMRFLGDSDSISPIIEWLNLPASLHHGLKHGTFPTSEFTRMPTTLPNELIDRILGYLPRDHMILENYSHFHSRELYDIEQREAKDFLIDCSNVCRTWRQIALPYLFHTIAFYFDPVLGENISKSGCPARRDHEAHCTCKRWRSLDAFFRFIDKSPHIANLIQELRLFQDDCENGRPPRQLDGIPCDLIQLSSILHRLPNLRVLCLQDIVLEYKEPEELRKLAAVGPPLSLDRFYFGIDPTSVEDTEFGLFLPLVTMLGDVREFHLDHVDVRTAFDGGNKTLPPYFRIGALTLWSLPAGVEEFLSLLLEPTYTGAGLLHSMDFDRLYADDLPVLQKLLAITGSSLTQLTMGLDRLLDDCSRWTMQPGIVPSLASLDLSPCTRLESLTIQFAPCFERHDDGEDLPLTRLIPVLESLRCLPCLQTITFFLLRLRKRGRAVKKLAGPTQGLDEVLVQIPSLKRVVLDISCQEKPEVDVDEGMLLFPKCKMKGLLHKDVI
ncbi:hypothetical protein NM688_g5809 [Phlebia brevispora]|uniref:Uncharacterized protein n=1 Tax=Phlebia brevispora TaxID=194682 RepID=A0ACC1SPI3_9APHY|nr:hypothetical protein NM688_g5809 [Phlebia brevispora]